MAFSFQMNKYARWYWAIVTRAQSRKFEGYTEKHHILPRSLGGKDHVTNIVRLTAREHFVVHLLLPKCFEEPDAKRKMGLALQMMMTVSRTHDRYKPSSRFYELAVAYVSRGMKGRVVSEETKQRQSAALKGRTFSDETRQKMANSARGRKASDAAKQKMSEQHKGQIPWNKGKTMTEEQRAKSSQPGKLNGMFGRTHTEEARKRMKSKN